MQNVADVSVLQKHLRKLVPLLLEDGGEADRARAALEEKSALEQMRKFLSDRRCTRSGGALRSRCGPQPPGARSPGQGPRGQWALCLLGLSRWPFEWRPGVSRAERGRRPHPGLRCHMSSSVSVWSGRAGWQEGSRQASLDCDPLVRQDVGRAGGPRSTYWKPGGDVTSLAPRGFYCVLGWTPTQLVPLGPPAVPYRGEVHLPHFIVREKT